MSPLAPYIWHAFSMSSVAFIFGITFKDTVFPVGTSYIKDLHFYIPLCSGKSDSWQITEHAPQSCLGIWLSERALHLCDPGLDPQHCKNKNKKKNFLWPCWVFENCVAHKECCLVTHQATILNLKVRFLGKIYPFTQTLRISIFLHFPYNLFWLQQLGIPTDYFGEIANVEKNNLQASYLKIITINILAYFLHSDDKHFDEFYSLLFHIVVDYRYVSLSINSLIK